MTQNDNYWGQPSGAPVPGAPGVAGASGASGAPTASNAGYQAPYQGAYQQAPGASQTAQNPYQIPQQPSQAAQQAPAAQTAQAAQPTYQAPAPASYQQPPAYQSAPPKKSRKWIAVLVVVLCLLAFCAFAVNACVQAIDSLSESSSGIAGVDGLTEDAIGVIELSGTIQYDGSVMSPEGFKEMLDAAEDNPNIKAIVLRVNSGGGASTAGEEMAEYLRKFSKPVVVSSASINASAAYEISSQADYIYVAKSTEIGAIGTVMEMTDLSGLFEKLGINMEVIASAESKDSTYGYRALTDDEKQYYQRMVDQINDMFVENVALGRKMDEDAVRKLATGLVFTGVDAVDNGLADAIGTREDALDKAAELAGIGDYETTNLRFSSYDISSLAYLLGESRTSAEDVIDALKDAGAKGQGLK